jgi:pimeloyl-ACP methyl ester carboxylesterase
MALIRLKATQRASKGLLFVNPGGPGGSGVGLVLRAGDILSKHVDGYYDIIGFDPRGVGASNTIRCFDDGTESMFFLANRRTILSPGDNPANHAAWLEAQAKQCISKNNFLPYVSTASVARDIDSLRDAFGQELTNYWGFSYGTFLGATYVNMFPDRVGRVILDGVTDPSMFSGDIIEWIKASLVHTEDGVDEFGAACEAAGPEKCALAHRDLALAFDGEHYVAPTLRYYLNHLINHPLLLSNVSTTQGVVLQTDVANAFFLSLYKAAQWPNIAKAFAEAIQASTGNGFYNIINGKEDERCPLVEEYSMGASPIFCLESTHHSYRDVKSFLKGVEEAADVSPLAGNLLGSEMLQCLYWKVIPAERYAGPWNHKTKNKVLLIGATGDPITPVESAAALESLMEGSGVLHKHHGWGHCSLGHPSKCTTKVVRDYFVDGKVPEKGSECLMEVQPFEPIPSMQSLNDNDLSYQELSDLADAVHSAQRRM